MISPAGSGLTPVAAVAPSVSTAQALTRNVFTFSRLLTPPECVGLSARIISWGFSAPVIRLVWAYPASTSLAYPEGDSALLHTPEEDSASAAHPLGEPRVVAVV